ncbi:hypothetical protein EAH86_12875 [Pedococcus bigeumensis]|uniref:Uncharacterized protein n=1 Tax=Pedococcus bigeumensis TaxID=433644 RepID=A0A502CWB4_9MICO|nr:hypothetical protein EAH86_12875 [Pedococcus bigeumensis]
MLGVSERTAGRVAARLLAVESALLAVSLPGQLIFLLSLRWQVGPAPQLHRMAATILPLELLALVTGILAGCAAAAVARRRTDAFALTVTTAVLTVVQAIGWAGVLQGHLQDPALATAWTLTTVPPLVALALLVVARRRSTGSAATALQ